MASIYDLSTSEASNSQTAGWNTAENQDPSTVNDGLRQGKQVLAAFRDDLSGYLATGSADALAIALSTVGGALAYSSYANGQMFQFRSASANTTSVTANVNSIGAKQIRKIVGGTDVALVAGDILPQVRYNAVYSTSVNAGGGGHILLNPEPVLVGAVVRTTYATPYTANSDLTTTIPADDTIPQVGEGTEILTAAHTPLNTTNKLRCRASINGTVGQVANIGVAMFVNGGANAVKARRVTVPSADYLVDAYLEYEYVPGAVSAQTISVRVGPDGGTCRLNGNTSGRNYGGVASCTLAIEEIRA